MPLYSVKNKFYRRLQRGALNGNGKQQRLNNKRRTTTAKQQTADNNGKTTTAKQQRQNDKNKRKKRENTYCLIGRLGGER